MEAEELWEILDADQSGEIDEDRTGRLFVLFVAYMGLYYPVIWGLS